VNDNYDAPLLSMEKQKFALQICPYYIPPYFNIAQQYAWAFSDSEYRLVTVFLTGEESQEVANDIEGDVVFLGCPSLSGARIGILRKLVRLHRQYNFRIIIAHRYKSIYLGCLLTLFAPKAFLFGVVHSARTFRRFFKRFFINRFAKKLIILGVSSALVEEIRLALPLYPSRHIKVAYNRINTYRASAKLIPRVKARAALGIPDGALVFATVARLHRKKNHELLVRAFAKIQPNTPRAVLLLIGDGDLRNNLEALARDLGIGEKVIFAGFVREAERYYGAFDVFVLPSRVETFGMVLLEAFVAELPVIASSVGGIPEVLGDAGKLYPVDDVNALAALMNSAYQELIEHGLSLQQKQRIQARLEQHFSFDAGRRDFWRMYWELVPHGEAVEK
jgi:glycosyltransferase involved in cell wall biosynthesis